MKKPKIVFFGNERLATGVTTQCPTLSKLIEDGYEICAVVSNYEKSKSRNSRELEIKSLAEKHGIPVLLPSSPKDIAKELESIGAEIGVLVAYGRIVPQSIIDIFPKGIVNIHPSLLPLHRGPTPIESVILSGEPMTGVSIMKLVKEMDAGPVYGYSEVELTCNETKQELADQLLAIGASMLTSLLGDILNGTIAAKPQDENNATYDRLIVKNDGYMDYSKPAEILEREVRAYAGWPKSQSKLADIDVIITSAKVSNNRLKINEVVIEDKQLFVGCGDKSLKILALKPKDKQEMSAEAFLSGYGNRLIN